MSPEVNRGPISPSEAAELQTQHIPDEIFVAFNGLIAQNLHQGRARVGQNEVLGVLEAKGMDRREIFDRNWLDVEPSYRQAGWKVAYDKPGFNESYEASFTFVAKNKKNQEA